MLEYFNVLETALRAALRAADAAGGPTRGAAIVEPLVKDLERRVAAMAARVPEAAPPTLQQIRKTLESVLDPAFFEGEGGNPLKAVATLRDQLRYQKAWTPPEGGAWRPGGAGRRRGGAERRSAGKRPR